MPYSLDIQGKRFVAELSGGLGKFDSTQNSTSLDGDSFSTLQSWLPYRSEWIKRDGFDKMDSGGSDWGTLSPNSTAKTMVAYKGGIIGNTSYPPYYAVDTTDDVFYALSEHDGTNSVNVDGGNSTISDDAAGIYSNAQVGSDLLITGVLNQVECFSGTAHTEITGKTATFAAGDATVTGISTALSAGEQSDIVGSYLVNTGDSAATKAVYRIASVTSSTELELDRPFNGSNTGATKAFTIRSWAPMFVGSGSPAYYSSSGGPLAKVLGSAWGRAIIGDFWEDGTRRQNRIRWSGVVGSSEGTAPHTGVWAFDDDGYLDLPASGGSVTRIVEHGDAVLVFQENLLTILYGAPEFNGAGSLDASTAYDIGISRPQYNHGISTPYGVFFSPQPFGSNLWLWSGSGPPKQVHPNSFTFSDSGTLTAPSMAYSNGKLLIHYGGLTMYDIENDSWTLVTTNTLMGNYDSLQRGTGYGGNDYTDKVVMTDGQYVIDVGLVTTETTPKLASTTSETVDITTDDIIGIIETGVFGPRNVLLRPERAYLTYALGGTTAYVEVQISTGLSGSVDTWTSPTSSFKGTSGVVKTERVEIDHMIRGIGLKLRLETKNTPPRCRILSLVVEGSVEGIGDSND